METENHQHQFCLGIKCHHLSIFSLKYKIDQHVNADQHKKSIIIYNNKLTQLTSIKILISEALICVHEYLSYFSYERRCFQLQSIGINIGLGAHSATSAKKIIKLIYNWTKGELRKKLKALDPYLGFQPPFS